MTIKVISQTTAERKAETRELFEKVKPYLDQGLSYRQAVMKVRTDVPPSTNHIQYGWYRDLVDYAKSQGYTGQEHGK